MPLQLQRPKRHVRYRESKLFVLDPMNTYLSSINELLTLNRVCLARYTHLILMRRSFCY